MVWSVQFLGAVAPEIDTRTVERALDLREERASYLPGSSRKEVWRKSINEMPVLGDIPILGALFRSTDDELEQNELAFFITPRLVKPIAPGIKPELPTDNEPTPDEVKEFEWICDTEGVKANVLDSPSPPLPSREGKTGAK